MKRTIPRFRTFDKEVQRRKKINLFWHSTMKQKYALIVTGMALALSGCLPEAGIVLGGGIGSVVPADEIEQTYYLGVYDPQGQLPPSIYRIRVNGQSSFLNDTKFASGWVHSSLIDSLGSQTDINETDKKQQGQNSINDCCIPDTDRKHILFGPEGHREAPGDHRLVIVMGADPSAFFDAVDGALGVIAQVTQGVSGGSSELSNQLLKEMIRLKQEQKQLSELERQSMSLESAQ